MNKFTLIVVDVQRDFYHPTGSLYVNGGEQVVENIVNFININHENIKDVIFTMDWHPCDLNAYKEPNIEWPVHCAQNSEGAGVANDLINACISNNIPMKYFYKGQNAPHTEYGAFENIGTWMYANGDFGIFVNNRANNNTNLIIDTKDVVVCGIAGDYCVMNTIKNLKKYTGPVEMEISTYIDGICSIDNTNATIKKYCIENQISLINVNRFKLSYVDI